MRFEQLDKTIPRVPADKTNLHVHTLYIAGGYGWSVRVKWPGKHKDSAGDFVVETLSEPVWDDYHQFTHTDLFEDVVAKFEQDAEFITQAWLPHALEVVSGATSPHRFAPGESDLAGIHIDALTNSLQALAVCEYRRYPQGDVRGGGRYLPINFMLAIIQRKMGIEDAKAGMRRGWPVLRDLNFQPFKAGDDGWDYCSRYFPAS